MRKAIGRLAAGAAVVLATTSVVTFATGGASDAQTAPLVGCGTALVAIPSSDEVLPVDVAAGTTGTPIAVPGAAELAVSPDATTAYVVGNHATAPVWTLSKVDLTTGTVGAPVPITYVPDAGPISNVVVSPGGSTLLIGTADQLGVFDADTLAFAGTIAYPAGFVGGQVTLQPGAATAYVASGSGNGVLPIDLLTGTALPLVGTGVWPINLSSTPDGATIYSANQLSESLTPIATATRVPSVGIPLPFGPEFLSVRPDGTSAVASNSSKVAKVDLATGAVTTPIDVSNTMMGNELMPDGHTLLAIGGSSAFSIDVDSAAISAAVPLPGTPLHIAAVVPSQAPTAAAIAVTSNVGVPAMFDASKSTATCGTITDYRWDFGDGTVQDTAVPNVQHTYAAAGDYHASLTVTDSSGTSTEQVFTGQATLRNGGPEAQAIGTVTILPAVVVTPHFTG